MVLAKLGAARCEQLAARAIDGTEVREEWLHG